jgi:Brp/Blh family beta-carotene 15,15'-monooxygenase
VTCLRPWVLGGAWACVLLLIGAYPLFPRFFNQWQFVPFILGMVLLGLPHGAMDHLVVSFEERRSFTLPYFAIFFIGYLGLTLAYLAFWRVLPPLALGVFLVMSWLHWGQGEAWALHTFLGRPAPTSRVRAGLVWAVRGALPILLPPLAFPAYFQSFTRGMLAWYGTGKQEWGLTAPVRDAGLGVLAVLAACYAWAAWREYGQGRRQAFWIDLLEIALLTALFLRVPPILAVGVYFCVWHAARHIARLMLLDPVSQAWLAEGRLGQSILRTAGLSLPLTVAALGLLGGLYAWQPHRATDAGSFVYFYLSLIAALTFPHFLLVLWMDQRSRLCEAAG